MQIILNTEAINNCVNSDFPNCLNDLQGEINEVKMHMENFNEFWKSSECVIFNSKMETFINDLNNIYKSLESYNEELKKYSEAYVELNDRYERKVNIKYFIDNYYETYEELQR